MRSQLWSYDAVSGCVCDAMFMHNVLVVCWSAVVTLLLHCNMCVCLSVWLCVKKADVAIVDLLCFKASR